MISRAEHAVTIHFTKILFNFGGPEDDRKEHRRQRDRARYASMTDEQRRSKRTMSDEKREERNRKRRVAYKMKADKENLSAAEHEDYNEHTSLHVSGTWSIIIIWV